MDSYVHGNQPYKEELTVEEELDKVLISDNENEFVSLINDEERHFRSRQQELLEKVCDYPSVKCATALINGETPLTVDLNRPSTHGLFPLHYAALSWWPSITELFLYHGAQTDLRCHCDYVRSYNDQLPLNLVMRGLWGYVSEVSQWTSEEAIFKLLTVLCLPRLQDPLEIIEMLAWKTKQTDVEFLNYARHGKLPELAALLMVAREKLTISIMAFRESVSFLKSYSPIPEEQKAVILSVLKLFDVFEMAGDAIEAYVKEEKTGVTKEKTMKDVKCLLQQAGLRLKHSDTDLSGFDWFKDDEWIKKEFGPSALIPEWRPKPTDIGMPHYSKSGHRWTGYSMGEKAWASNEKPKPPKPPKPVTVAPNKLWGFNFVLDGVANFFNTATGVRVHTGAEAESKNKMKGGLGLWNLSSSKLWASLASVIKGALKRI